MKWQESYKNSKYFFRPYIKSATENEVCNIKPDTKMNQEASKETQLMGKVIFLEVMSTMNKHYYWCIKKIGSNSCF